MFDQIKIKTWIIGLIAVTILVSVFATFSQDPLEASDELFASLPDLGEFSDEVEFNFNARKHSPGGYYVFEVDARLTEANEEVSKIQIERIYDKNDHSNPSDPDCDDISMMYVVANDGAEEEQPEELKKFREGRRIERERADQDNKILGCCRKEDKKEIEFRLTVGREGGQPTVYKSRTFSCKGQEPDEPLSCSDLLLQNQNYKDKPNSCSSYLRCSVVEDSDGNPIICSGRRNLCEGDCSDDVDEPVSCSDLLRQNGNYKDKPNSCSSYLRCSVVEDSDGDPIICSDGDNLCKGDCSDDVDEPVSCSDLLRQNGNYKDKPNSCSSYLRCSVVEDSGGDPIICSDGDNLCEGDCSGAIAPGAHCPYLLRQNENYKLRPDPCSEYRNCNLVEDSQGNPIICPVRYESDQNLCEGDCFGDIANIEVIPNEGVPGTAFHIRLTWISGISPTFKIYDHSGDYILAGEHRLYDDGKHGDSARADGIYAGVMRTAHLTEGTYSVIIKYKDYEVTRVVELKVGGDLCSEVIPGHNNVDEARANIVFVGFGRDYFKNQYVSKIGTSLDFGGSYGGILSQEPFRSNKDRFNAWYVTELGDLPPDSCWKDCDLNSAECVREINKLAGKCREIGLELARKCVTDRKYVVALFDSVFRSHAYPSSGITSISARGRDPAKTVTHEWGHIFGRLHDEYLALGKTYSETARPQKYGNLFHGSEAECRSDSQWSDVIGQSTPAAGRCRPDYWNIGCFEGTFRYSYRSYRSVSTSIMRNQWNAIPCGNNRAFGLVNEKLLCDEIERVTGRVSGEPCELRLMLK